MTDQPRKANVFKTPVFALHAFASNSAQWQRLANELAGRFSVTAVEFQVANRTDPFDRNADLEDLIGPALDRIIAIGQPVHLVGHSLGGAVALNIALRRPDLVSSLTLYEPAAFHVLNERDPVEGAEISIMNQVLEALHSGVASGTGETDMQGYIDYWNGPGTWDGLGEKDRERLSAAAPTVLSQHAILRDGSWSLTDIGRLTMPALILMGMDSPEGSQSTSAHIANAMPNGRLAMLPGAGHMAPIFEAEWVNPRIVEHLVNVERPPANCFWPHRAAA